MRAGKSWVVVLWVVSLLLGGCVEPGPSGGDSGSAGEDDTQEQDGTQDQESGQDGTQDQESEQELEVLCDERSPPRAFPHEQSVGSREEVRCPGHFAVLDNGSAPRAVVPGWSVGDWWHWRVFYGQTCFEVFWEVTNQTVRLNTSVYVVGVQPLDCAGDPADDARSWSFTQESLARMMSPEGFIRHMLVFPLADGKQWVYMDLPMGNVVHAHVSYEGEQSFGGDQLEVWRVEREGTNLNNEDWLRQVWFSPEVGNKIREEYHVDGVLQESWVLKGSSGGFGEAPVPGLLGWRAW